MKQQIFNNFFNGKELSKWVKGFSSLKNIHAFGEYGVASCANEMKRIDTTLANATVMCNWADKYLFIFNEINHGVYRYHLSSSTLVHLFDAPNNVLSAASYQATLAGESHARVYFATRDKLYKIEDPGGSPTASVEVGTFTGIVNDERPRPMLVHGLDFYIGTDEHIASVDASGVFTAQAVNIENTAVITDLVSYGNDILISGISLERNIHSGFVLRYDTFSESFYMRDELDEDVNCLIHSNNSNIIFASVGTKGDIYYYNGNVLDFYKTTAQGFAGDFHHSSPSHNSRVIVRGQAYFATPTSLWTIHRRNRDDTFGLVEKYTGLVGITSTVDVGSVIYMLKDGRLYYDGDDGHIATGQLDTSVIQGKVDSIEVAFHSTPTTTAIKIYTKKDADTNWIDQPVITDTTDTFTVRTKEAINNARSVQVRIELIPSGNNSPIIEYVAIK